MSEQQSNLMSIVPRGIRNHPIIPANLTELMTYAKAISDSQLIPPQYRGKPADIILAVQLGLEVGLNPAQAIQNIYVVNGRPTLWGDALLGLVKASGLLEFIEETIDKDTATCKVKRLGEAAIERKFSKEDAVLAGLWEKGVWKTYPKRMLQMRARAFALRDVFPDVLKGLQCREEIEDIPTITVQGEVVDEKPNAMPVPSPILAQPKFVPADEQQIKRFHAQRTRIEALTGQPAPDYKMQPELFGFLKGQEVHIELVNADTLQKINTQRQKEITDLTNMWVKQLQKSTGLAEPELQTQVEDIISQPFPVNTKGEKSWLYLTNDQIRLIKGNL